MLLTINLPDMALTRQIQTLKLKLLSDRHTDMLRYSTNIDWPYGDL